MRIWNTNLVTTEILKEKKYGEIKISEILEYNITHHVTKTNLRPLLIIQKYT